MLIQSSAKVTQLQQAAYDFVPLTEIGADFIDFLVPLHKHFTPRQQELALKHQSRLANANCDRLPDFLPPSPAITTEWKIGLPEWCRDQRNQMTGPADNAELVVKMLRPGESVRSRSGGINSTPAKRFVRMGKCPERGVSPVIEARLCFLIGDRKW